MVAACACVGNASAPLASGTSTPTNQRNKPQDIDRFRNDPYWRERFGTDPKEHKRFRWARFYQAMADGLVTHAADRSRLIAFLQQLQPSVENLGLLSGDQFADGSKGFIQDIDPFTLFGLFNRGIKDSNRGAIASRSAAAPERNLIASSRSDEWPGFASQPWPADD